MSFGAFGDIFGVYVQMSTSVQWTTEVVTLVQSAQTLSEVSHASADQATPEMDSPVQVIILSWMSAPN